MKKLIIAAVAASGLTLAACSPVGVGTGVGAGLGFLVTAALGGSPQAIAIGTLVGGAGGFVVSSFVQAAGQPQGVCQAYSNGQPLFVTNNGQVVTYNTGHPLLVNC